MIMQRYIYFVAAVLLAGLNSCEKVIDIDLKNVEKKYVIEGFITDEPGTAQVLISKTKDFSDNNDFNGVTDAVVTISDDAGNTAILNEMSAGLYNTSAINGEAGKTYTLTITINGETFTATSTMPQKVNMDTLYLTDDFLFGETRTNANIEYQDPPGKGQSYRFIQYVNGVKSKSVFIENDNYNDGNIPIVKLRSGGDPDDEDEIKSGDVIKVEMLCIDENVYDYWYGFVVGGATGNSNTASPANPRSNISGAVLGYFSAHTIQSKTVTVP